MNKLVFSSDELPQELDDQARFNAWRDIYLGTIQHFDVERLTHLPFRLHYEFVKLGEVTLASCDGTVHRFIRTAGHVAADPCEDFFLTFNGPRPWGADYDGRSYDFASNAISFLAAAEAARGEHAGGANFQGIVLPRKRVSEFARHPDDLVGRTFDPQSEAARHFKRYVEMLLAADGPTDEALATHVQTTLLDLAALLLDQRRDAVDLARMRGLRSARVQEILAQIKIGFADPAFTPRVLAAKLGFSANYIQKLLYETGATFTDRLLELRLQKGRAMSADRRNDHLKVSDIALACGFNEVSYFNRCFRRRFGAAPSEFRGLPSLRQ